MGRYIQGKELGLGFAPQLPMTVETEKGPIAWLTSDYGYRFHPVLKKIAHHNGIDIGSSPSVPLYSVEDGVVTRTFFSDTSGNVVEIGYRPNKDGKFKYLASYSHMVSPSLVKTGKIVSKGQIVGFVGTTGRSTGPHLHFIVKQINRDGSYATMDPLKFIHGKLPVASNLQEKGGNWNLETMTESDGGTHRSYGKEVSLPVGSLGRNILGLALIGAIYLYVNKK